jgi:hypothetical protein
MTNEQTIRFNAIKALDKFASHAKGGSRPILQKINVSQGHAVAADGFHLMATPTKTNGFTGNLNPADILALGKAAKKPTTVYLQDIEADGNHQFSTHTVIADDKNAPQIGNRIPVTDDAYPDWRQIMPASEPTVSVRLNARYLRDLADAALAMGANHDAIELHLFTSTAPVKFTFTDGDDVESFGVIMPMKLDK